jgi:ParB-like chromosome segregation protein Spo0J
MFRWLNPRHCVPPHRVTHEERLIALVDSLSSDGWKPGEPALIGYEEPDGTIQLVSGSHRWAAAAHLDLPLPVYILPRAHMDAIWGTDAWVALLAHPPTLHEVSA